MQNHRLRNIIFVVIAGILISTLILLVKFRDNSTLILVILAVEMFIIPLALVLSGQEAEGFVNLLKEQAAKRNGTIKNQFLSAELFLRYDNYEIRVFPFVRGGGKHKRRFTGIEIRLPLLQDRRLSVYSENIFTRVGKALGMKDLVLNHPAFDESFVVSANDEGFARKLFGMDLQQALLTLKPKYPALNIEKGRVLLEVPGRVKDSGTMDDLIKTFELILNRLKSVC